LLKLAETLKKENKFGRDLIKFCDQKNTGQVSTARIHLYIDNNLETVFKEREKFALINLIAPTSGEYISVDVLEAELERAEKLASDPRKKQEFLSTMTGSALESLKNIGGTNEATQSQGNKGNTDNINASKIKKESKLNELEELNITGVIQKLEKSTPISRF
jgi:hypothetical protein